MRNSFDRFTFNSQNLDQQIAPPLIVQKALRQSLREIDAHVITIIDGGRVREEIRVYYQSLIFTKTFLTAYLFLRTITDEENQQSDKKA